MSAFYFFVYLLARLFSKKMSRYCHSPFVVDGGGGLQNL